MKSRGFTLIELIIVVVVIGILAAIAIPNYYSLVDKAKIASVVANMHTAQVTVETEAMELSQTYFPNIASFVNVLPVNFINPYDQGNVSIQNEVDINIEGVVEYKEDASYYTITGYGKDLNNSIFLLNPATHAFWFANCNSIFHLDNINQEIMQLINGIMIAILLIK